MRGRIALALVSLLALGVGGLRPEELASRWTLWEAPVDAPQRMDVTQERADARVFVRGGADRGAAQVFVPADPHLARIDLMVRNRSDERPARFRLWELDPGAPRPPFDRTPLFEDVIDMSGGFRWRIRSVHPDLSVEPGRRYLFEVSAPGRGPLELAAASGDLSADRPGDAWIDGEPAWTARALWYRTWSPAAPGAAPSEPPPPPGSDWEAPPPPAPVSTQDYLERVRALAAGARQRAEEACGRTAHREAFLPAFLYAQSCDAGACDAAHARETADLLQLAADWRACAPSLGPECRARCRAPRRSLPTAWLIEPAWAYLAVRDAPALGPEDHRRTRDLIRDAADRILARRKRGVSGWSMAGAASVQLAAEALPDAPSAAAWRAAAQEAFDELRTTLDHEEDSASYAANLFWPSVLLLMQHVDGGEALWQVPGFRALVERAFDPVMPLGVLPNYGDGSGWAAQGQLGLIWLFEEAGARYREGRFRWLAHRIFDYQRSRVEDRPPQDDSLLFHVSTLALAARAADESVEPVPPAPLADARSVGAPAPGPALLPLAAGERLRRREAWPGGALTRIDLALRAAAGARFTVGIEDASGSVRFRRDLQAAGGDQGVSLRPWLEPGAAFAVTVEARDPVALRAAPPPDATQPWIAASTLRGYGSVLTMRRAVRRVPPARSGSPPLQFELLDRIVPSKLVLRSGPSPDAFEAVFNLASGYRHGQMEQGALVGLVDSGSVLLGDTPFPYPRFAADDHEESDGLLRRRRGGRLSAPQDASRVDLYRDHRGASVAAFRFGERRGWDVEQERRVLFVRDRMMLVRDRFRFGSAMKGSVGSVWHAGFAESGPTPQTALIGWPAPLANAWRVRNPERRLLLWLAPVPDGERSVTRIDAFAPPPGCPRRPTHRVRGRCPSPPDAMVGWRRPVAAGAGDVRDVAALLVPEGAPGGLPALADGIRSWSRGEALVVSLGPPAERWWLVDNPERADLRLPGLETDARYLVARIESGSLAYLLAGDAGRVRVAGEARDASPAATWEEGEPSPGPRRW